MKNTIAIALLLLPGSALAAQDKPALPKVGLTQGADDAREEMKALFAKVERRLNEIDKLLYDAGAGGARVGALQESGIAELLERSKSNGQEVLGGIDRILEIAREQGESSSSSGSCSSTLKPGGGQGGSQPKDGSSPKQGASEPQQREQTPEAPGSQPQGAKPGEGDKPEQDGKPKPGEDGQPKGDQEHRGEARNSPGSEPPKLATEKVDGALVNERWGELPVQVRDLFRTEGGASLPPQYRDWIDAYYRRLNQPVR